MGKTRKNYWLVKSEPESFSIDDLQNSPERTTCWDGVRNYQARNTLRDAMRLGDEVLFYHSNAKPPCIVGITRVVREGYPDTTAFDRDDPHFDPKSKVENPTWFMVDLQLVERFSRPIGLDELKTRSDLTEMVLLQRGSRLSVQPVRPREFQTICRLGRRKPT